MFNALLYQIVNPVVIVLFLLLRVAHSGVDVAVEVDLILALGMDETLEAVVV